MKTLAIWFGKRYALGVVQDMVSSRRDDVGYWAGRVARWVENVGLAARFLGDLADRLRDGELTAEEAEQTLAEARELARQITGEAPQ